MVICYSFKTEELDQLIKCVIAFIMKLSKDNDFEIEEDCLDENNNAITNFQHYLKIQKKIFESAA